MTQCKSSGPQTGAGGAVGGSSRRIRSGPWWNVPTMPVIHGSLRMWEFFWIATHLLFSPDFPFTSGRSEPAARGRAALVHQRAVHERFLSLVAAVAQLRDHRGQLLVAPPEQRTQTVCPSPVTQTDFNSRSAQFGSPSLLPEGRFPEGGKSRDGDSSQPRNVVCLHL